MTELHKEWEIDDSFMAPPVRNADNQWLGPMGPIGHVWEVNGAGTEEVPQFHATRHELLTLVKYWVQRAVEIEYQWFLYQQVGSSDRRLKPFAWARVKRIRDLLGEEVDKAIEQVYEKFGSTADKEAWEIFLHGTNTQRAALQEQIQRSIERDEEE